MRGPESRTLSASVPGKKELPGFLLCSFESHGTSLLPHSVDGKQVRKLLGLKGRGYPQYDSIPPVYQTLSSLSVPLPERSSFFFTSWILGYFGGDHGELAEAFPGSLALLESKSGRNSVGRPLSLPPSSSPWPLPLSHHHTQPLPQ